MVPTGLRSNHFLLFLTIFLSLTSLYRALSPLPLLSALCPGELLRLRRVAAQRIRCDRDKVELEKMVDARGKLRLGNCLGDPLGEGETPTTLVLGKISDP